MYGCSVLNYKKDFSDKLLNFLFSFIVHDSFLTKIFCNYEKYLHAFQTWYNLSYVCICMYSTLEVSLLPAVPWLPPIVFWIDRSGFGKAWGYILRFLTKPKVPIGQICPPQLVFGIRFSRKNAKHEGCVGPKKYLWFFTHIDLRWAKCVDLLCGPKEIQRHP